MWMLTQIVALDAGTQTYFTPWFPKGADNGVFTLEKVQEIPSAALGVKVFTKNREDEGSSPGTEVGTFGSLSGAFHEVACTGLKELVRFKLTVTASQAGQGVIFRFLPPTWYDTAV